MIVHVLFFSLLFLNNDGNIISESLFSVRFDLVQFGLLLLVELREFQLLYIRLSCITQTNISLGWVLERTKRTCEQASERFLSLNSPPFHFSPLRFWMCVLIFFWCIFFSFLLVFALYHLFVTLVLLVSSLVLELFLLLLLLLLLQLITYLMENVI